MCIEALHAGLLLGIYYGDAVIDPDRHLPSWRDARAEITHKGDPCGMGGSLFGGTASEGKGEDYKSLTERHWTH